MVPARRAGRRGVPTALAAVGVALFSLAMVADARLTVPPAPAGRISDYAGLLSPAERARLDQRLAERESKSSNQVAVAIFRALEGENLEDFTARLFQTWRLGQKGLDNGVVLVVFVDDRRTRIEVGYGLEATLTDAVASGILSQDVAPHFRAGRFADGIERGLDAIDRAIAGTHPPVPERLDTKALLAVGLFALLVVAFAAMAARRKRPRRRPGWTGDRDGWGPVFVPGPVDGGGWDAGGGGGGGGFGGGGGGSGGGGASGSW